MIHVEPMPHMHAHAHEASNSEGQLRSIIERVERLHEERKALADDIRDVLSEAKANGFDTKAIKAVIKYRSEDVAARAEHDAIVETYLRALGVRS